MKNKKIIILMLITFGMMVVTGCSVSDNAGKAYVGKWSGPAPIGYPKEMGIYFEIAHVKDNSYAVTIAHQDEKGKIDIVAEKAAVYQDGALKLNSMDIITVQNNVMKLSWLDTTLKKNP